MSKRKGCLSEFKVIQNNLDLNAEDSDHEGKRSAIDDQPEASDHQPGEDEPDLL